jgi:AhpD family alkylhydroperoxidase
LFGHLSRMARQGQVAVRVEAESLPAFPGAIEAFREGVVPGAVERNREYLGAALNIAPGVDEAVVHLGCDAQTSGGLLIAITPGRLESLRQALASRGAACFVIGAFAGGTSGEIQVAISSIQPHKLQTQLSEATQATLADQSVRAPSPMNTTSPHSEVHQPGCCADLFEAKNASSSAAEAQKAFGAMMRTVQAGGALSEKAKELILFSLVVYSRCEPCFETHWRKARDMGFTELELDEAAWCAIAMGGAPVRMFYQEAKGRTESRASKASADSK